VSQLPSTASYSAYVIAFQNDGLTEYAMVAVPITPAPAAGYPVLVADHGFHPDPPRYGISATGVNSRPGDYYRSIPGLYAARGFMVVMPDYRGHSNSEGLAYTKGFLASAYYTSDVLAVLAALPHIAQADTHNVFMWGHSMGGEVTLRALLATGQVRAASLWSAVGGDLWDQAHFYSRYKDRLADDSSGTPKPPVDQLRQDLDAMPRGFDWLSIEPLQHLGRLATPVIIHHSLHDTEANYDWSERLAQHMYQLGKPYEFHTYPGNDHFLAGDERLQAVERDVHFFRAHMTTSGGVQP
jgi:dipeptidyl aminopeptidase/acylaminoacyl peptidase